MKIKLFGILFCLCCACCVQAQELMAHVTLNTKNIQGEDAALFTRLEQDMTTFLNERHWTNLNFKQEERIKCNVQLILDGKSGDNYTGRLVFQMSRPVFNSTYTSNLMTVQDDEVSFPYSSSQGFDYDDNSFMWNLSAVTAFYVNYLLGIYFDSFSPMGGTPFFNQCQTIIGYSQTQGTGWAGSDSKSKRNRYWLWENMTNPSYADYRNFYYKYHRMGMDLLSSDLTEGVTSILDCLKMLQGIAKAKSSLYLTAVLMTSKSAELINVFSGAPEAQRHEAQTLLTQLDPANASKYAKLE